MSLQLLSRAIDISNASLSEDALVAFFVEKCEQDQSADIILWPEYVLAKAMELSPERDEQQLIQAADFVWKRLVPELSRVLRSHQGFCFLGTAPFHDGKSLFNRSLIFDRGVLLDADKVHLTPWESQFVGGDEIRCWGHESREGLCKIATITCLDIEIPETALKLKTLDPDVVLVAAATESRLGCERIARCASSRSVELCAYVATAHLRCANDYPVAMLADHVGGVGFFQPSQTEFTDQPREIQHGFAEQNSDERHIFEIDLNKLHRQRSLLLETNPRHIVSPLLRSF